MTPAILNNRYRVLQVLGRGGFGETFLAEDSFLPSKRHCVLKQLRSMSDNPQVYQIIQERFHREAAILEELGRASEQVPELYAYFEESGQFYLVQEWIAGQTLAEKVRSDGLFTEPHVRQLLDDILPVLGFIHGRGIIHRDIKPDNVILRHANGKPVLIDFGAVKESVGTMLNTQGQTISSIVIGTPGYMSPEQGVGRPVFSSDLYSLGLTVIYLLTGKLPQALPSDYRTGELLWRMHAPVISDHLAGILDKTIQYHPRDRFATAQEMLMALQNAPIGFSIPPTLPVQHPGSSGHGSGSIPSHPPTLSTPPSVPPTAAIAPTVPNPIASVPPSSPPVPPPSSSPSSPPFAPPPSPPSIPPTYVPPGQMAPPPLSPPPPTAPPPSPTAPSRTALAAGITATLVTLSAGVGYLYYYIQQEPYRAAQADLEEIQTLLLRGDHQACIHRAETFPKKFPELFDRVTAIGSDCATAMDEAVLEEAKQLAEQPNADLNAAIAKADTIPANSPVRPEAEEHIFDWQAQVLQAYLRDEVPKNSPNIADRVRRLQPTVVEVTAEQVTISYDTSQNSQDTGLASGDGLRLMTVTFMEQLKDKEGDLPTEYTDFLQLITYSQQGNQTGSLRADQWNAYVEKEVSADQLLNQVEVANR